MIFRITVNIRLIIMDAIIGKMMTVFPCSNRIVPGNVLNPGSLSSKMRDPPMIVKVSPEKIKKRPIWARFIVNKL